MGDKGKEFSNKEVWKQLKDDKGTLLYEGFTIDDNPHGAGCAFFANGKKYKEGVFDCKGLVYGREYYSNGELRFEGAYGICHVIKEGLLCVI